MVTSPDMTIERATGTSDVELLTQRRDADRVARLIVTLVSVGEMLVAVAILALPREVTLLLVDASLDGRGLIVPRMMGIAVLALGMTWWMARRDADGLSRYSAGFIAYNLGIGALFGGAALAAVHPAIPWIVCGVHLVSGLGFGLLVMRSRP